MKLEARHNKVIAQLNKDTFTELDYTKTQGKAIQELYNSNKIIIGCIQGNVIASCKLSQRINYNNTKRI